MTGKGTTGRTGRRRGHPQTRGEILRAAKALFAERGFAGTSIRGVATAAGVDVALVYHYFTDKEDLFRAALEVPIDPEELIARIVSGGPEEAPGRLVETFVGVWDAPDTGPAMVGFLRRLLADEGSTDLIADFIGATFLRAAAGAVLEDVEPGEAQLRMTLVASQMLGLAVLRRVLRVEPIASMPAASLAAAVTPTVVRYLRGDLSDLGDLDEALTDALRRRADPNRKRADTDDVQSST